MNEEPQKQNVEQLKEQMDELLVNVRNEAIVQTANLYIVGRQALLAGIGLGALTLEAAQGLLQRAVERGEIAEADAEAVLARMREEGMAKSDQEAASAASLTDRAAVALADSVSTILRSLRLHGTDR
jgi:hypothetical protein